MKDMGETAYILGVKIERDRSKKMLALSEEYYIRKVLENFHMQDCKFIDTPIAKGEGLTLRMCPKTPDEKAQMEKSFLLNCCRQSHVCYDVYWTRY
jgi:hypothetical protein